MYNDTNKIEEKEMLAFVPHHHWKIETHKTN